MENLEVSSDESDGPSRSKIRRNNVTSGGQADDSRRKASNQQLPTTTTGNAQKKTDGNVEDRIVIIDNIPIAYQNSMKVSAEILASFPGVKAKSGGPLPRGGYRLLMESKLDADRLLNRENWKSTAFGSARIWVHPPKSKGPLNKPGTPSERTLIQRRQLVSFSFPPDVRAESIKDELRRIGIVDVVDLAKTIFGNVPKLLTCESAEKADQLCESGFGWQMIRIRCSHYRPKVRPVQCGKCQSFDHSTYFCTSTEVKCPVCAGPHQRGDPRCTAERRCANCGGPHTATYGNCECLKKASDKATNSLLAKTRRIPVEQVEQERLARRGPAVTSDKSFAAVVSPSQAAVPPQTIDISKLVQEITAKVTVAILGILKPLVPALAGVDMQAIVNTISGVETVTPAVPSGLTARMEDDTNSK